jgi:excisionase family DNA binding protein
MTFLSIREAAEHLRVSERHLRMLISCGEIAVVHAGRRRLITTDALARFAEEHELRRPGPGGWER